MLPHNLYEYFNSDMKIFNFELPFMADLASDIL
jgi:hypothetical protein